MAGMLDTVINRNGELNEFTKENNQVEILS